MKLSRTINCLAVLSAALSTSALAQTRFCLGGDLDHLSQAQRAVCSAKMQAVRTAAMALHAPSDWHFVVVCGEDGWKSYTAYAADVTEALLDASASTDVERHETFFRESRINPADTVALKAMLSREITNLTAGKSESASISHPSVGGSTRKDSDTDL